MPRTKLFLLSLTICTAALLVAGLAVAGETQASPVLKKVEAKKVCMVNDQLFEKDMIPVQVGEKTYYGCCAMCKDRLTKDAAARTAVDPVTGKSVDKATAVIGAQADGKVLYFESEKTMAQYPKKK
ncbi:MAG TPA: TRASH domain-containing protein [Thermoanaerobaculia bacterium]|nr:TRASH domain-containing protein [Thermoanaerobaculia bacterium]